MATKWQIMRHRTVYKDGKRDEVKQLATDADGKAIEFASEDKAGSAVGVYNMTDPIWSYHVQRKDD